MIIKADAEGKQIIERLCDIALRANGLSNLQGVTEILSKIETIEQEEKNTSQRLAPE